MIIFDLDGTLANCEHRRHFVDPKKNPDLEYANYFKGESGNFPRWQYKETGKRFFPAWKAFYEACDKDTVIEPVMRTFSRYWMGEKPTHVEIWSGRCESVRKKTLDWLIEKWFIGLYDHQKEILNSILKMRPIGDNTPDDQLKERWLDEEIKKHEGAYDPIGWSPIDFVFDSHPKSIKMWRRRGIFVFNCCQHGEEF